MKLGVVSALQEFPTSWGIHSFQNIRWERHLATIELIINLQLNLFFFERPLWDLNLDKGRGSKKPQTLPFRIKNALTALLWLYHHSFQKFPLLFLPCTRVLNGSLSLIKLTVILWNYAVNNLGFILLGGNQRSRLQPPLNASASNYILSPALTATSLVV